MYTCTPLAALSAASSIFLQPFSCTKLTGPRDPFSPTLHAPAHLAVPRPCGSAAAFRSAPPRGRPDACASLFFCCPGRVDQHQIGSLTRPLAQLPCLAHGLWPGNASAAVIAPTVSRPILPATPSGETTLSTASPCAARCARRAARAFCLPAPAFGPGVDAFPGCGRDLSIHLRLRVACGACLPCRPNIADSVATPPIMPQRALPGADAT